ncbi:putative drug resistance protein [Ilyonectria robusta]
MTMAQSVVKDHGVLAQDTEQSRDNDFDMLDQKQIEILGRQRPAVFSSWLVESGFVLAVVGSLMMSEYTISGFNIALPALAETLDMPESARTWPAAVPNLTTAALLLPFARLSERYGGRVVFLAGHMWLMAWSLVCGFSQNPTMLIVCRAMQGIGSSAFLPASLAVMGQIYRPGPRKNLVFSAYGAFGCIGFFFGVVMGAVAAESLGWRWYFWMGAIFVFLIGATGFLTIPSNLGDANPDVRMDWWGLCTIVPGLALVVFALTDGGHAPSGWRTPYIYVTFVLGILFLCAAVYVEGWVSAQPLLPVELFRPKYMKRLVASLFMSYGIFGLYMFYASFYIESVLQVSPLQTAAWFSPLAVGGLILALVGGFVLHILPGRMLLIISGLGFLASVLLFALIPENPPSRNYLFWAYIFPAMVCGTIGVDIAFNVTNIFITTSMPRRLQAVAGALCSSLLYLGMAFWLGVGELAVTATIDIRGKENVSQREQYQIGFWTGVGLAAASLCLVVTINLGQASASLTADEQAELKRRENS